MSQIVDCKRNFIDEFRQRPVRGEPESDGHAQVTAERAGQFFVGDLGDGDLEAAAVDGKGKSAMFANEACRDEPREAGGESGRLEGPCFDAGLETESVVELDLGDDVVPDQEFTEPHALGFAGDSAFDVDRTDEGHFDQDFAEAAAIGLERHG